ncbi:MAG: 1-acyl-sn-glycerol-3-phosphate acyltransferase [Gemmatimonadaceae bacterium]
MFRWIAGIAVHWFYSDIRVVGREHIPSDGPLLIAVNHWNALIDTLIVGWLVPRRITMTAKATLAENAAVAALFRTLNVVPLRRVSDEPEKPISLPPDKTRNAGAFREIARVLRENGAVLIFPEGKSHNGTRLEPLKTGLARVALTMQEENPASNIKILPIGVVFENKGAPGTAVDVHIGEPIELRNRPGVDRLMLTAEIASRLRAVSEAAPPIIKDAPRTWFRDRAIPQVYISVSAWWGNLTHRVPIQAAKCIAIKRSTAADDPATLTILFGVGFTIVSYIVQLAIVGVITRSFLIDCLYLLSILNGAYWAAFQNHRPHSGR